jgi:hypothetical protein
MTHTDRSVCVVFPIERINIMASVIREILIESPLEDVWAAVSDFAAGPMKMAPGVFVDCKMEGADVRALFFADGTVARERLIARDEEARRMAWGWVSDEVVHDNASMQVFRESDAQCRLVWIHDTLPDRLTDWLATAMDQMAPVFQQALKSPTSQAAPLM